MVPLERNLNGHPLARKSSSGTWMDVPINEDEQEEKDIPVPAWLARRRDRRKRPALS